MKIFLVLLTILFLTTQFALATPAIPQCNSHDNMEALLAKGHGERITWHGLTDSGFTVRLYQNDDTGSWTATAQRSNGPECINGVGNSGTKLPFRERLIDGDLLEPKDYRTQ